jgi:mRNA interferase RelE/StbE
VPAPERRRARSRSVSPGRPGAEVWLTDPAVEDLRRLDGSPLLWALKKLLLLESNPLAGEPLLGNLIGYRKLTVGNRDWRIVWRATTDERGDVTVEIAEVWAVGARSEAEVYQEMVSRVAQMPDSLPRRSLSSVLEQLGGHTRGIQARTPHQGTEPVPAWLVERLVHTAGLDRATVEIMTSEEAVDAWTEYMTNPR